MLAHTMAELTKNPSTNTVARRMIRRFRIVVPPKTSWISKTSWKMPSDSPPVLLDFNFIKFIEIGFTFSISFLSSRIIGVNPRVHADARTMSLQPQESPESSWSGPAQRSPAILREIYEQPRALRETIRRNVEGSRIFISAARSTSSASEGENGVLQVADQVLFVPPAPELLLPILEVVPFQLFAYHFAAMNGCDGDHPRHFVKTVVCE